MPQAPTRAAGRRTFLSFLAASAFCLALAPAAVRAGDGPRLSGPFAHENLTIWLVHGESAPGPVPLTLPEAIEKGVVEVKETGSVNELTVENRGAEEVFIQAGDIVKGGRQDRVLSVSLSLPPRSGVLPIAAYCVEQGRWSARTGEDVHRFASAKEMLPSREAKIALRAVKPAAGVETGDAVEAGRNVEGLGMRANRIGGPIQQQRTASLPSRHPSTQGEVWAKVGEIQAGLSSNLATRVQSERSATSLQLALENDKLAQAQRRFADALEPLAGKDGDVVGFVFAVNGKLNSADIYASNGLFRKLWPRLLKASATEAIGAQGLEEARNRRPDADLAKVAEFLANPPADVKAEERAPIPGLKLELRSTAKALDSQTKTAGGAVVHRNVLSY